MCVGGHCAHGEVIVYSDVFIWTYLTLLRGWTLHAIHDNDVKSSQKWTQQHYS